MATLLKLSTASTFRVNNVESYLFSKHLSTISGYLFIINKTIRSSGRAVIYQVFLTCLAESEAGQILS